jgi:hypothetical protein
MPCFADLSRSRPRGTLPALRHRAQRLVCLVHVAASTLAFVASACSPSRAVPQIAAGERPVTGDARYDAFFTEVSDLVVSVQEARREYADVRAALARRTGLPGDTASDALGARLRERTTRLASEGLTLELEFTGIDDGEIMSGDVPAAPGEGPALEGSSSEVVPTATLRTPGREPERRELRLLEVVAQAALSGATIYADMGRVQRRSEHLLKQAGELRKGVGTTFPDVARRERVDAKLLEAETFLPDLSEDARSVGNDADILIALLDEAANTATVSQRKRPTRETAPARDTPARDGPPREAGVPERAARRPAPKAEPAPTPAPERATGDFEP